MPLGLLTFQAENIVADALSNYLTSEKSRTTPVYFFSLSGKSEPSSELCLCHWMPRG